MGNRERIARELALAALLVVYGACVLRTAWLSDDAYITFRSVENFAAGYGPRWNVAERVQAFTHPLWMLLVSGLYLVTHEIYFTVLFASIVLSLASFALLGWRALRLGVHPLGLAGGLGALIVSRAFVDYSTSGLENALSHLLLICFVLVFLDERRGERRLFVLAILAALGTLNRTDTFLLYAPALGLEVWRRRSRASIVQIVLGLLPLLLWEAFSIVYYGFPFANSAYAKLRTGIPLLTSWAYGLAYFANSLRWDPVTLAAVAVGVALALALGDRRCRALAVGVLLYLAYVVHIGGDFMSGRFFAAPLLVVVATDLVALGPRLERGWARVLLPVTVLFLGLLGARPTLLPATTPAEGKGAFIDETGIADERAFYFASTGLLSSDPVEPAMRRETVELPERAAARRDPLAIKGAVGLFGERVGPGTYVLDYHGLGDPLLARLPMVLSDPLFAEFCVGLLGRPCARDWRIGHFLRNIPDGYMDSLLADDNLIVDPDLREYYAKLRLITRGPIWSAERWAAIVGMNLGLYEHLLGPRVQVAYRPTSFTATMERQPELVSFDVRRGAGDEYLRRGEAERAVACYEKLIALDPTDSAVWNQLGNGSLQLGRVDEAIDQYRRALTLKPNFAMGHYNLALALSRAERSNEAVDEYREAIRLQPRYILAHNNLGVLLFTRGESEAAIAELRQVVQLKPDYADGQFSLGTMLLQVGNWQEAIPHLRAALRLRPDYAAAEANLRQALARQQERN